MVTIVANFETDVGRGFSVKSSFRLVSASQLSSEGTVLDPETSASIKTLWSDALVL